MGGLGGLKKLSGSYRVPTFWTPLTPFYFSSRRTCPQLMMKTKMKRYYYYFVLIKQSSQSCDADLAGLYHDGPPVWSLFNLQNPS